MNGYAPEYVAKLLKNDIIMAKALEIEDEKLRDYIEAINVAIYAISNLDLGDNYISDLCEINHELINLQDQE